MTNNQNPGISSCRWRRGGKAGERGDSDEDEHCGIDVEIARIMSFQISSMILRKFGIACRKQEIVGRY
ncbi:hypothetical protein AAHA92_20641 [Salvia divinorum]|uniref:Uncharacterized protein n=1 Tax=Salvia divinorum TaxID=28513 RepID=A0ABD1GL71_SALDI